MKIPRNLISTGFYDTPAGTAASKKAFHTAGKAFLRAIAAELGNAGSCKIDSCLGGPGVLGEATLHSDKLYMSIFESSTEQGVRVLYRSCRNQQDSVGGANRYASMKVIADSPARLQSFIADCKRIEEGLSS